MKSPRLRQTFDILTDLRLADERVHRDARILAKLRDAVYRAITGGSFRTVSKSGSTLYRKYETSGFPVQGDHGRKIPKWRDLSPWMKVQIAQLALAERGYRPFKVHLHDDLRESLEAKGKDQRAYLRDRIRRQLRQLYGPGNLPLFYFVVEDRDKQGELTRPHAHGAIEIRPLALDRIPDAKVRRRMDRIGRARGADVAMAQAGRWAVRRALRGAAGLQGYRSRVAASGLYQNRNVWMRKPTFAIFNECWVTYVFKNAAEHSPVLGETRLVFPYDLLQEARKLWAIIRG